MLMTASQPQQCQNSERWQCDAGAKVIQEVLEKFLKASFKLMPEEGIQ